MFSEDTDALSKALHRKLLNINNDIRKYRLRKPKDKNLEEYTQLKATSKVLDKAYSACKNNLKQTDSVKAAEVYRACLSTYNKI